MRKEEFGTLVRERREERKVSLRQFAVQMGVDFRQLSRVERGEQRPEPGLKAKLAAALKIESWRVDEVRTPFSKAQLTRFTDWPRFYPERRRPTRVRYRAGMARYARMRSLERRLPAWAYSFLRRVICDSALEAFALVQWLAAGAQPALSRPYRQGFRCHAVADPSNKLLVNHHRFPALALGEMLIVPQVPILAGDRVAYVCDALVKFRGRWFDVEIDGKGHTTERDEDRERDLLIPVVRIGESFIDSEGFIAAFEALLEQACG